MSKDSISKAEKFFDIVFILVGIFALASIVTLGSTDRKLVCFILPIFLLLKFIVFRHPLSQIRSLVTLANLKSYRWLVFHVFLFSFIPIIMGNIHNDLDCKEKVYWVNVKNGVYYITLFLYSVCFINVFFQRIKDKISVKLSDREIFYLSDPRILPPLALLTGFVIEFIYYFTKNFASHNFELFYRWEAGSSNANVWAVQSSIALITLVAYYAFFKNSLIRIFGIKINLKVLIRTYLFIVLFSTFLTGSITNLIGILLASIPILFSVSWWFIVAVAVFAVLFCIVIVVALDGKYDYVNDFDFPLSLSAKKFLPRMRLWSHLRDGLRSEDFSIWIGLGFCEYVGWTKSLLKRGVDHLHNVYYHYFYMFGLSGLYAGFAYLINIWKQNKYTYAIVIYILISSCTDASLINSGPQLQFWMSLPFFLILDQNSKSIRSLETPNLSQSKDTRIWA